MIKKDFFRIIIKLIGLYWIVTTLYAQLPYLISVFFKEFNSTYLPYALSYFVICISLFVSLVFYTDKVISLLKLDKGFDEDRIEFSNFNIGNIIKLALIIVSCILIVNNISPFINQSYNFLKLKFSMNLSDTVSYTSQNDYIWATSFVNLLSGYLILTNYPAVSSFLLKITQKKEE